MNPIVKLQFEEEALYTPLAKFVSQYILSERVPVNITTAISRNTSKEGIDLLLKDSGLSPTEKRILIRAIKALGKGHKWYLVAEELLRKEKTPPIIPLNVFPIR
jgi:hypothetical protein